MELEVELGEPEGKSHTPQSLLRAIPQLEESSKASSSSDVVGY